MFSDVYLNQYATNLTVIYYLFFPAFEIVGVFLLCNLWTQVVGYSDTDLAEYLYKRKPHLEDLINYLCKDLTESCAKKPPPVPKATLSP